MAPTLEKGWKVKIEPKASQNIAVGEVIVFTCRVGLIMHRLVGRFQEQDRFYFIHKGDNSRRAGIVDSKNVIGVVHEAITPAGIKKIDNGKWLKGHKSTLLYFCIISLVLTILYPLKRSFSGRGLTKIFLRCPF